MGIELSIYKIKYFMLQRLLELLLEPKLCSYLTNDAVQSPALVEPGDLLPHSSEEALGVEEASDPEHLDDDNIKFLLSSD